jgi:hypothetical protein
VHGAWLPLLIAVTAFTILTTWQRGRRLVTERREHDEGPLREFIDEIRERTPPVQRVPGTAVFLNRTKATAPLAMRASVEHLHALGEHVVILSSISPTDMISSATQPAGAPSERRAMSATAAAKRSSASRSSTAVMNAGGTSCWACSTAAPRSSATRNSSTTSVPATSSASRALRSSITRGRKPRTS